MAKGFHGVGPLPTIAASSSFFELAAQKMEGGAPRSWFISIGYSCAILPSSRFLNPDEHVLKRLTDPIITLYNYSYGE